MIKFLEFNISRLQSDQDVFLALRERGPPQLRAHAGPRRAPLPRQRRDDLRAGTQFKSKISA